MAPTSKSAKPSQQRRNERERKRVHQVNDGFDLLRNHVPKGIANKKMSKADTLREATKYIQKLQAMLQQDYMQSMQQVAYPSSCSQQGFYSDMDMYFPHPSNQPISPSPIGSHTSSTHISPAHLSCSESSYQQQYNHVMRTSP